MFISPKDYRSANSSNFAHGLSQQQNTSALLIAHTHTHTSASASAAVTNTKSSAYSPQLILRSAAAISLELLQQTVHVNGNTTTTTSAPLLPPSTPTALFTYEHNNESAVDGNDTYNVVTPRISSEIPIWLIPCYSVIFFFAIVGNLLVISTLAQNRRMRTITNVFLLNLAISDILLGVLCMPVTLVGTLLRHFIFGEFFCKLIQFSQAASVAVSSWTLVAISCERYYAICHPLRSRTWQTINHAYRIIGFIWFGSIICMTPIAVFSQLMPTSRQGLRKCREQWPEDTIAYERSYNIFLDLVLLVLPLLILCAAYILITRTLYVGMRAERALIFGGYATGGGGGGDTPVKQHDSSPLEAIATVTKSSTAPTAATLQPSMLR
ncbi:PREDICTED: cholecystokinin receptor type A-like, partial [Rhagoletis zephyria]|uniref:cholecystokinin receptor type A-like n=1 Tax=Rhagoletis zephyria TaxID=28612 RepID=UPI000811A35C